MDSSPLAFLARLASLALLRRRAPRAPEGLTVGRAFALAEGSEAGRACWAFRVSARRTLDPTLDVVQQAVPYLQRALLESPPGRPMTRQPPPRLSA